jgi:hypothetical protein
MWQWRIPAACLLCLLTVVPAHAASVPSHNIAIFGDSLADGVWAGLYQEEKANPQDKLFRDSKVGTGLTRPDYDTFVAGFIGTLDTDKVTDAVVMFGANDDEGLRDDNHHGYLFQSPGWVAAYTLRVDGIIAACQKRNIRVFWLGLPVMRAPDRNQDAIFLNGILQKAVTAQGETFIPLEDRFKGTDGTFALYLPDAKGNLRQFRAPDGTHFTFLGYDTIAKQVLTAIETPPPAPATTPPAAPPAKPVAPPAPAAAPQKS